jgi:type II secretory pathway pseudopilin PulG
MSVRHLKSESGFTMIAAIIGTSLIVMLALVAVAAVEGDVNVTQNDLARKQAFEAAKAGIDDYAFHLNANNVYWTHCTEVPAPSAVNQIGSTANRRSVPGGTGTTYAIELIPATGHEKEGCNPKTLETATNSMIEPSGAMAGSFRIRSTGYYENSTVSIVATFKRASFLDYMYFTQLETSDPVTYGNEATVKGAYEQ